ncbi:MAG: sialate O-acetylesterase [Gemmataceae bacterium]
MSTTNRFGKLGVSASLAGLLLVSCAEADVKPERGKDRIDVPAVGAGLCVHNLFQSGMVIQRDKPIRVWGWADPGEKVTVAFGAQARSTAAAKDRSWRVELRAEKARGEPHRLVVEGEAKKIELENVVVGDVWVLGGQSNMEFEITKVEGGPLEVAAANFKNIRLFSVPQLNGPDHRKSFPSMYQWSDWFSQHYRQGYWDVCTPHSVREMSAIGYVFARRIHMATHVPIGVIDVSRGGTCLETWTPIEVLKSTGTPEVRSKLAAWDAKVAQFDPQKDLDDRIRKFKEHQALLKARGKESPRKAAPPSERLPGPAMDLNRPGNCYASMIAPLAGFQVKGVVWHQGYNNALDPNGHALYAQVFPKMIGAWRAAFDDPQMPFGIISLCTEGDPQDRDDYLEKMANEGVYIREAHFKTFLHLLKAGDKNIGYASSYDQRRSWYHPQIKIPVGERIARWALATQYGMSKQLRWMPPMLREVRLEGGKVLLQLDTAAGPYHDGPIEGFAVAGKNGRFQPARAEWFTRKDEQNTPQADRTVIVLSSPLVPEPVFFRHAWGRNPQANLKSMDLSDLPFPTQRNDAWTLADMYEIYTGKKPATPAVLDARERQELSKALRAEDLKRRIAEAKELLRANGM